MRRAALGLAMWMALASAGAQQVWRCEEDGQVSYTDQPCEKSGRPVLAPAASAASDAADGATVRPAAKVLQTASTSSRRGQRGARSAQFAMHGLMDTDFVQRGHAPRRQNPASTPTP